jgi:hypothetical protein
MSPASYLTAPPRVAAPIVAPSFRSLVTIAPMWDWAIWGALIVVALAVGAASALLARHALRAWRDVKDARRDVVRRLDDLSTKVEATTERVAAAGATGELQESIGRLRVSLAQLAVLRAALDEAHDDTVGRVTAYLPRR